MMDGVSTQSAKNVCGSKPLPKHLHLTWLCMWARPFTLLRVVHERASSAAHDSELEVPSGAGPAPDDSPLVFPRGASPGPPDPRCASPGPADSPPPPPPPPPPVFPGGAAHGVPFPAQLLAVAAVAAMAA
jgi:hypothetical protein